MEEIKEEAVQNTKKSIKVAKPKKPAKDKKTICSIIVFVIGIMVLVAGVVFLVLNLLKGPEIQDGEYLVSAKDWVLDEGTNCGEAVEATETEETKESNAETNCLPSVIWDFTEIGKGSLTTNGHTNDYNFIWAIEDGKLLIETDWLYELENEYNYTLDQNNGVLILNDGEDEFRFVAEFETE